MRQTKQMATNFDNEMDVTIEELHSDKKQSQWLQQPLGGSLTTKIQR
jgi:hypothetical protein